ncbi:unknown [Bacteroides sp. CAG:875]|nr:unknown [Bacteroides sp. CAG:875]
MVFWRRLSRLAAFVAVAFFTSFTSAFNWLISVVSLSFTSCSWVRASSIFCFWSAMSLPSPAISVFRPSMASSTAFCFSCKASTCVSSLATRPSSTFRLVSMALIWLEISSNRVLNSWLAIWIFSLSCCISSVLPSITAWSSAIRLFKSVFTVSSSVFSRSISSLWSLPPSVSASSSALICCSMSVTFSFNPFRFTSPLLI